MEPATEYRHNWHIDAITEHLEAITFGRMTPRLIINVSPGSMKSLLVSVMWQAWLWGPCGQAAKRFLSTSFEIKNVTRDTRKTRDLIMSDWFQTLWPLEMTRVGEQSFANIHTGSREGVAFAGLMGKRGDVVTIDDAHSLDGAESDTERDKATRRFIEGGQSRVNDMVKSAIVIVMQRVHMSDLTGVILDRDLGYEHLMIPMEFEPARRFVTQIGWTDPRQVEGELMDPSRFPPSVVDKQKNVSEYMWNGQFQQRPAPREGGLFKVDKIEIVEYAPEGGEVVRGWDLAASKTVTSPWTVGLKMRQVDGILYIEDVRRVRMSPFEVEQLLVSCAESDGLECLQSIPQDPGQSAVAQKQYLALKLAGHNFRFSIEEGKKEHRATPFSAQVESGMVRMVRAPWNSAYIDELRNFPNSTYKDQVDATSRAFAEFIRRRPKQIKIGASMMLMPQE